jgi:phasin family protein
MADKVPSKHNPGKHKAASVTKADVKTVPFKPAVAKVAAPEQVAFKPAPVMVDSTPKPVPAPAAKVEPVAVKAQSAKAVAPEKPAVASVAEIVPPPVVATPVVKPAPAASKPETKGVRVMATTVPPQPKAAAEKVNMMIADFNDRAKTAFEKTAKAGEELTEFTKGNLEAFATSAKTAAKGAESLGQELADYGKKSFETASATMKSLAAVKTPTELFQIQSDYAKSAFDSAFAEASKLSEAWLKLAGEIAQPISSRYALAAEKIKSAAL